MSKNYTKAQVKPLPGRMVEIVGEISAETMGSFRSEALKTLKNSLEVPGFRKGMAPENVVVQKIGEVGILEEAAEMALNVAYPEILDNEKVDGEPIEAIGRPDITITKIAPGNALEFKIVTALAPKVKLADYKKVAKGFAKKDESATGDAASAAKSEITEKEIDDVILNLRKDVAHAAYHQKHDNADDHSHGEFSEADLPEVNEEFLKMLGGDFATVEDLRNKIRETLANEKKMKAKDKRRTDILEKIIAESAIELPDLIVNAELDKMIAQFKDDIARAGATYEEYLKHIKKTEEDIRKEWRETAEKRAKSLVTLSRISEAEKLTAAEEDIKREMDKILAQDSNLDRFRVRMFVESFLSNDLVFAFLENI